MLDALLERFRRRDRLALARALSLLARGEHVEEVVARLPPAPARSRVVAFTGSGGVGKSTLIGKLIDVIRRQGLTVAVLACDPQSPVSGGALLGDRFRMAAQPDDGVFIRSLAARGGQGALAEHLGPMVRAVEAFGFDVVVIETVGAGQGDTAVGDLADVLVLLLQPEAGDELQWEKAGVLEVADVVVINKADLPGAERVESQVRSILGLSDGRRSAVVRVSPKTGEGVEDLWKAVSGCPLKPGRAAAGQDLLRLARQELTRRFASLRASQDPDLKKLLDGWEQGAVGGGEGASALLRLLEEKCTLEIRGGTFHR